MRNHTLPTLIAVLIATLGTLSAQETINTQPTAGLVAHWSFDADTNKKVVDSQGTSNGIPTKVEYREGVIGKAASFNGKSSKIIIKDPNGKTPTNITGLTQGTVSFWVKFTNRGGQVLPILYLGKDNLSTPYFGTIFEIGHDRGNISNRRLYFTTIAGRNENFCVDSGMNLQQGVWYHYTAVMSDWGSTLYLNGVEITTRRYNLNSKRESVSFFNNVVFKSMLSIGYGRYSQEGQFLSYNGLIDDMRIYDRPLSAEEVTQLFNLAGLEMGDPRLGYIDARSMVGKEPTERGKGNVSGRVSVNRSRNGAGNSGNSVNINISNDGYNQRRNF